MIIYHIVLPEIWDKFIDSNTYEADSLSTEGFIHCSFAEQIAPVLGRYYAHAKRVMILHIDSEKLSAELKCEPSSNNEIYPHIYGKINKDAIFEIETREF